MKTQVKTKANEPHAFKVIVFEDGPVQFYITPPDWTAEGFCCLSHADVKMLS